MVTAAVIAALVTAAPGSATAVPSALGDARAPAAELNLVSELPLRGGGRVYRYEQQVKGVPVLDGQVVVSDPPRAPAELVADSSAAGITPPPAPNVSMAAAISSALRQTRPGPLLREPSAELALLPSGKLVWRVLVARTAPLSSSEVLVDAATGTVLDFRDRLWRRSGRAKLFNPNPVALNGGLGGLRDRGDRDGKRLNSLRRRVALQHLQSRRGCLKGTFVHVTDGTRSVCKKNRRFTSVTRSDEDFEALMAYFHVDRTQTYISSLGLGSINRRRQRVHANAFPDDNSAFEVFSRRIFYGTGGTDDGEDGDVVVHEYGHAVQDSQVSGFGASLTALSIGEGWADYLAAVMSSRSPGTTAESNACLFEWDGLGACIRRADNLLTYPQVQAACAGDPHCLGLLWVGALWKLRGELGTDASGRSVMDSVALTSHFMLTPSASFQDARDALLAADAALYGGVHQATITNEFTNRGL